MIRRGQVIPLGLLTESDGLDDHLAFECKYMADEDPYYHGHFRQLQVEGNLRKQ